MAERTVRFGVTSKNKTSVIHKQFEFVKHRDYVNGTVQWRCAQYQKCHCLARLTTDGNKIISDDDPEHNHGGNKANILAHMAVADMKKKMSELSATTAAVIGTVSTELDANVLMALPKRVSLKRTLQRSRRALQSSQGVELPPPPSDTDFVIPQQFDDMILYDSGPGQDRTIIIGCNELLDGLARAKLWLADGTFKVVPSIFFQLYSIHFELVPGITPAAVYCLVQNKQRTVYDNLLTTVKNMIPLAAPERILVDFEQAAIGAFRNAFPNADVRGCYFHLTQSVQRKIQELGLKTDYESNDELRIAVRYLPALSMVPPEDVVQAFDILSDSFPDHEKTPELLAYFEHTYIRGRRRPGRGVHYGSAIFPINLWNHYDAPGAGIARTTNAVEGWHYGLQSLFQCHHPTLWSFMLGIRKDMHVQKTAFLQGILGLQPTPPKRYRDMQNRVQNAVDLYSASEILLYLRSIAHMSYV
jgi:MULE transposase domain/FLYWCH zinc finger domain